MRWAGSLRSSGSYNCYRAPTTGNGLTRSAAHGACCLAEASWANAGWPYRVQHRDHSGDVLGRRPGARTGAHRPSPPSTQTTGSLVQYRPKYTSLGELTQALVVDTRWTTCISGWIWAGAVGRCTRKFSPSCLIGPLDISSRDRSVAQTVFGFRKSYPMQRVALSLLEPTHVVDNSDIEH